MIIGIAHVNLTVTPGSLDHAQQFYGETLGLKSAPVPEHQVGSLLWYVLAYWFHVIFFSFLGCMKMDRWVALDVFWNSEILINGPSGETRQVRRGLSGTANSYLMRLYRP